MELWFSEPHTENVKFSIRVDRQLYTGHSAFQRIDVFESPDFGRFLALDGYIMLTEMDEFIYHEMITHVPMAVHPAPRRVHAGRHRHCSRQHFRRKQRVLHHRNA